MSAGLEVADVFAERPPDMIRAGEVPPQLIGSERRYANFLLLKYARQLLDCGQNRAARAVLLELCRPGFDPSVLSGAWRSLGRSAGPFTALSGGIVGG